MLMKIRDQKGFTLIELLIVVIILGILAVIAIPRFMNNRQQAEVNACRTSQRMLADAIARFNFDNATPLANQTEAQLKTDLTGGTNQYLTVFPVCPGNSAGGTYSYTAPTASAPGRVACATANHTPAVAAAP